MSTGFAGMLGLLAGFAAGVCLGWDLWGVRLRHRQITDDLVTVDAFMPDRAPAPTPKEPT